MAIFSKTQIPKYQNPVRITRPYIKPNYLADTITSAIQGYGSIQNTNMQRQLFNAKLKEAADAKAQRELDQAGIRQAIMGTGVGAQQAGTAMMNLQGGDPYGIAGIPAYSQGALNQTYQYDTPAVPGMSPMDSLKAAMQANPQANPASLMAIASQLKGLQPTPAKPMSALQALQLAMSQERLAFSREGAAQRKEKHTTTMGNLVEKENLNFLLRLDNAVSTLPGLQEWDTPWTSGGDDLTGPDALKAFGATIDDEEWSSMRQKAVGLYRHLKDNTSLTETEIDDIIFKMLPAGVRGRKSNVFMGDTVTQTVQPSEIVELIQERRKAEHGLN